MREDKIASVVAFSLIDLTKPANASQLVAAAESVAQQEACSRDDVSIISSSATVLNSPVQETAPMKQESVIKAARTKFLLMLTPTGLLPRHHHRRLSL
jgi:hypothetical protein